MQLSIVFNSDKHNIFYSDTGEQMAVGVTILLSFAVFFLLLEDKMPETSDAVPLLGKYYACTIVEASIAVGAVCMVLCFHHHDPTDVPPWMRVSTAGLTKGPVIFSLYNSFCFYSMGHC